MNPIFYVRYDGAGTEYQLYRSLADARRGFGYGNMLLPMCKDEFEKITGIKLKAGQIKRVYIQVSLKPIGGK